jgi:hypothetical protein
VVTIDADTPAVVDATSAMVNLGYKKSDAKQAVEQALSTDATLGNNLDGLLRAALANPSADETTEGDIPAVTHNIAPVLTRREIPALAAGQDKYAAQAALYHGAIAAAHAAANAIEEKDIEARFFPVLIFLTDRQSVTFGRYLETQGIRKGGPYGTSWRGRTCFKVPGGEPYRTYEEAWAYVQAFALALPDLDICYGVNMVCMDGGDYGTGKPAKRSQCITQCNAPEPSHGG